MQIARFKDPLTAKTGWFFWAGRSASAFGVTLTTLVITYYAAVALKLGAVEVSGIAAGALIATLLSPLYAGTLADGMNRRLLTTYADIGRGFLLAGAACLAAMDMATAVALTIINFFQASLASISNAAFRAGFPDIVGEEQLLRGNGRLQALGTVADTLGGIVGGAVVAFVGPFWTFAANAIAFLVSGSSFWTTSWPNAKQPSPQGRPPYWRRVSRGFVVVWRTKLALALVLTSTASNFFIGLSSMGLLWWIVNELKIPYIGYVVILSVGSAGALLGALMSDKMSRMLGAPRTSQTVALSIYSVMMFAYTLLVGNTPFTVVCGAAIDFTIGVALSLYIVNNSTQQQQIITSADRGSVSAVRMFGNALAMVLGTTLAGVLIEVASGRGVLIMSAVGLMIVAGAFAFWDWHHSSSPPFPSNSQRDGS